VKKPLRFRNQGLRGVSTLREILAGSSGLERRAICRTRINRGALLFFHGQTGVMACHVRDVTNEGAGIRLNGLALLPIDFELSFDNFRTIQSCHLVWRDGDFVGVTLDRKADLPAPCVV
jgi:hypothetical protein